MSAVALSLAVGLAVGAVFALAGTAPPAPQTWAGVAGIVGIVAGWQIIGWLSDLGWPS